MIPVSIQTAGITDFYSIDEIYKRIKEAGFDGVDANFNPIMSSAAIVRKEKFPFVSDPDFLRYFDPWKDAAKKYGLENFQAHAPYPCMLPDGGEYNDYLLEALKKMIQGCRHVGCSRLVIHPFFYTYTVDKKAEWELNIKNYSSLIQVAKENDVIICLENMFAHCRNKIMAAICSDMEEACRYVDTLNDLAGERRFAFCLDTGHLQLVSIDIKNAILKLGDRIEALHIHDNDGIVDQHMPPYMGVMDWSRFTDGLKEIGYKNSINFETYNALKAFDRELAGDVLSLIAKTGRLFARRIEG